MKAFRAGRRRYVAIPLLLVCLAMVATGCSINANTSNNGSCDGTGGNNQVNCNRPQDPGSGAAPSPSAPSANATRKPTVQNGKLVGTYQVTIPAGGGVPIGPSAPAHNQLSATGGGDLTYNTFSGEAYISPVSPYSTIADFNGVPTYQGCVGDTDAQNSVGVGQGSAFCLYESENRLVAGGVVTYIDSSEINPDSVTVKITVWRYSS
jgi:hypothetical protein